MNSTLGIIIALLYVVIQVFAYVAKESAKRKERERKMEEAERARMATARMEVPSSQAPPAQPAAPDWRMGAQPAPPLTTERTPARQGRPLDDLAERRKRQLAQMKSTAVGRPVTIQTPSQPQARTDYADANAERIRMQRRAEQARQEQQARDQRQRDAVARARRAQEKQRQEKKDAERARETQIRRDPETAEAPPSAAKRHPKAEKIFRHLNSRATLQELMILKEVLDPPMAVRQPIQ